MLERDVEAIFNRRVRHLGGLSFKFAPLHAGNPDRIVLMPGGRIFLVEIKTDEGTVDPAQRVWHRRASALGTQVIVIRGAREAREWGTLWEDATRAQEEEA